jgi:hypothetical protein
MAISLSIDPAIRPMPNPAAPGDHHRRHRPGHEHLL